MKRAIFFDRDGIINKAIIKDNKPYSPKDFTELDLVVGIRQLINCLKSEYLIFVITNQPEIARGNQTMEEVESINSHLASQLSIDGFLICPHDDEDMCECRKPKPGLILWAAEKYNIDLNKSWVIGDRWRDILAGNNAGCRTIFVNYGYDETQPLDRNVKPNFTVKSINEIGTIIELEDGL
jgi:D-glycero-D-manno-heptose 1,7-bisphosphate phosphatase